MSDLGVPDAALGTLALAGAVLYAAWHEYAARNRRDAKLLAAVGTAGLLAGACAWLP